MQFFNYATRICMYDFLFFYTIRFECKNTVRYLAMENTDCMIFPYVEC